MQPAGQPGRPVVAQGFSRSHGVARRAAGLTVPGIAVSTRHESALSSSLKHAFIFFVLAAGIAAQERTGTIEGTVVDATGDGIPNAAVEAVGDALVRPVKVMTTASGSYLFPSLPPGSYQLTYTAQGFTTYRRDQVQLAVGRTLRISVKLEVGMITETIIVTGGAVAIDTATNVISTNISADIYDRLPKGRAFDTLAVLAPGVRNEPKSGGYQVDGASSSENSYVIDGVEQTNIQNGRLNRQWRVPVEWVAETQVKSSGVDAQSGGAIGGVVAAITRSGSNRVHGQVSLYAENSSLDAGPRSTLSLDPYDDSRAVYLANAKDDRRFLNPGFRIGGPVKKDSIWFFLSAYPEFYKISRKVRFVSPDAEGRYTRRERQDFTLARFDWAPLAKVRTNFSYYYSPYRVNGLLPTRRGTDAYNSPWEDSGFRAPATGYSYQADYAVNTKLSFSVFGGYSYSNFKDYGTPTGTQFVYQNPNIDLPGVPAELRRPAGSLTPDSKQTLFDKFRRYNLNTVGSWLVDGHNLRFGWQLNRLSNDPYSDLWPHASVRIFWDRAYSGITRPGTFRGAYGYYVSRFYATQGTASSNNQALFVQDNWRVNSRLTLNLGLRSEREYVPSFSSPRFQNLPSKAIDFGFSSKLSPRIGFAYDSSGRGRSKLFASWGIYYDVMKYEMPRGSFGGDVYVDYFYTLDDPNIFNIKPAPTLADPGAGVFTGTFIESLDRRIPANDPAKDLIDPALKPTRLQAWDGGYELNIGNTYLLGFRYTHKQIDRTIEDVGLLTAQGEQYFITNPGFGYSADPAKFPAGYPPTPKAVRDYDALEFRLERRMNRGLFFMTSYTWSRLWGNYAGLASSDEAGLTADNGRYGSSYSELVGRRSPNINRNFDEPWMAWDARGNLVYGRLATDRPHTFKFFGSYDRRWKLGSTRIGPQFFLFSGTPVTTEFMVMDVPVFVNGRGDMGRTPAFTQTDLLLTHEIPAFRESQKFRLELNITNLFNNNSVLDIWKGQNHAGDGSLTVPDTLALFKPYDYQALAASRTDANGRPAPIRTDPRYGMPYAYQLPRTMRLAVHFIF
jgi:hypothetical protein